MFDLLEAVYNLLLISRENIIDGVTLVVSMVPDSAEMTNELITRITIHLQWLAMAVALHRGLLFERN